jgi:mono/diheme cytochrome c family protein
MPFVALFHTHKLVVVLFLLIYLIKTILLVANKTDALEKFKKITKIPEMIVSVLFLATGIAMIFQIPVIGTMFIIKLVAVVLSIPIAIIGFKKNNKGLAVLSLLLIIAAYGLAEMNKARAGKRVAIEVEIPEPTSANYDLVDHGRILFGAQCTSCHGIDGKLQLAGAKDLTISTTDDAYIMNIINKGKNTMPKMKGKYSDQEMSALTAYIKSLRTQ